MAELPDSGWMLTESKRRYETTSSIRIWRLRLPLSVDVVLKTIGSDEHKEAPQQDSEATLYTLASLGNSSCVKSCAS
jgi:hypothetical protein